MKKTIAIYGGSFNPINNIHLAVGELIVKTLNAQVVFLPVGDNYKKEELLPGKYRVKMIKKAIEDNKNFKVSTLEVNAKELLYAIDSLTFYKKKYPKNNLVFVLGSDNLRQLDTWKDSQKLLKDFNFLVIPRNNDDSNKIIAENKLLNKYKKKFIIMPDNYNFDFSSSKLRTLIKENLSFRYLVPEKVYKYIKRNKLFIKENKVE